MSGAATEVPFIENMIPLRVPAATTPGSAGERSVTAETVTCFQICLGKPVSS
jgi:hypothetical protein